MLRMCCRNADAATCFEVSGNDNLAMMALHMMRIACNGSIRSTELQIESAVTQRFHDIARGIQSA
jgi:hypothetical protein